MRSKQESLTAEAYNYDVLTVICVTESVSARGDPSAVTQTVSSALQTHYSKYGWSLWESVTDVLLCPLSYRGKGTEPHFRCIRSESRVRSRKYCGVRRR